MDPGPDEEAHLRGLAEMVSGASEPRILVTHDHADHAGGAERLARLLSAPILGPTPGALPLADGDVVETDEGRLVAIETPGHAPDHLSFHWLEGSAVLVGDLLLGRGDTTWVGEYPGCVADYLRSLDRLEALEPAVLLPAHGPPIEDPMEALRRYRRHREARIRQVEALLGERPDVGPEDALAAIYEGEIPPGLEGAALSSVEAHLHHVREGGSPGGGPTGSLGGG